MFPARLRIKGQQSIQKILLVLPRSIFITIVDSKSVKSNSSLRRGALVIAVVACATPQYGIQQFGRSSGFTNFLRKLSARAQLLDSVTTYRPIWAIVSQDFDISHPERTAKGIG